MLLKASIPCRLHLNILTLQCAQMLAATAPTAILLVAAVHVVLDSLLSPLCGGRCEIPMGNLPMRGWWVLLLMFAGWCLPAGQLPALAAAHPEAYTALLDYCLRSPALKAEDMMAAAQLL